MSAVAPTARFARLERLVHETHELLRDLNDRVVQVDDHASLVIAMGGLERSLEKAKVSLEQAVEAQQ